MRLRIGPGALVAAAFVGPGTVATCTLAGARVGVTLLWVLLLATAATVLLQEMALRLGVRSRRGLGEALRDAFAGSRFRGPATALVLAAVAVGNAAYEAGNLTGGALGVVLLLGRPEGSAVVVPLLGLVAAGLLAFGRYALLERVLLSLVAVMAAAFLLAAAAVAPGPGALLRGLAIPRVEARDLTLALALVGTTVVPYNLFLHSGAAALRFGGAAPDGAGDRALATARLDAVVSIALGGLVSMAIVVTAAGVGADPARGPGALVEPLAEVFGAGAPWIVGSGLAAAGLTSALTAPLATGWAATGLFHWHSPVVRDRIFRGSALAVLGIGVALGLAGIRPLELILFAQAANGLLLPFSAAFLLWAVNRRALMGSAVNGAVANLAGAVVLLFALGLGARAVLGAMGSPP